MSEDGINYSANYAAALARERMYLEILDDLMTAIAADNREILSNAYNRASDKIVAAKRIGLIAR